MTKKLVNKPRSLLFADVEGHRQESVGMMFMT